MDAFDCIATKLDIREFRPQKVPHEIKLKVLEAARLTGTGLNTQHWRFILVDEGIKKLAADSTSGGWVSCADFAVIVLTNPKYNFHLIDAGRVVQDMQLAAWNYGVASGVFTGVKEAQLRSNFAVPKELSPTIVVGFGYPARKLSGKKSRMDIRDLVFAEKYGNSL